MTSVDRHHEPQLCGESWEGLFCTVPGRLVARGLHDVPGLDFATFEACIGRMATESAEARLIRFVTDELCNGVTLMELYHYPNQSESLIRKYPIAPADVEAIDLADEIFTDAVDVTECFPSPQRFVARSFTSTTSFSRGQCDFVVQPSKVTRAALAGSADAPIERGLVSHLIRHTESAFAVNIKLAREVAAIDKARAGTAESEFHRYLAEKQQNSERRTNEAQRSHDQKMIANKEERDFELLKLGMDELKTIVGAAAPHLARRFGVVLDGTVKRGTSSSPPAPRESEPPTDATGSGERPTPPAQQATKADDSQTVRAEKRKDDTPEARRAKLEAVLSKLTEEDVEKLERALGTEKAQQFVTAIVDMLR